MLFRWGTEENLTREFQKKHGDGQVGGGLTVRWNHFERRKTEEKKTEGTGIGQNGAWDGVDRGTDITRKG